MLDIGSLVLLVLGIVLGVIGSRLEVFFVPHLYRRLSILLPILSLAFAAAASLVARSQGVLADTL